MPSNDIFQAQSIHIVVNDMKVIIQDGADLHVYSWGYERNSPDMTLVSI
jgi:hypothetical protein